MHTTQPDIKFVVIGDGRERLNLERRIAAYRLEKTVLLAGHIEEAWRYLKAFDVFVLPSLKEGFPWALLEAMAAELPVVATRVGAVPEVITSGQNGLLVEPGNALELAKAVDTLLEEPRLAKTLSANARKTVEQRFTLDNMMRKVVDLLFG